MISLLSEQKSAQGMGGTMRLGNYQCNIKPNSLAHHAYGKTNIGERHRHRYEFNNDYKDQMEKAGFIITGTLEEGNLCEISEIANHPWMLGVQFHPEFKSKPTQPHPLFCDFIAAILKHEKQS